MQIPSDPYFILATADADRAMWAGATFAEIQPETHTPFLQLPGPHCHSGVGHFQESDRNLHAQCRVWVTLDRLGDDNSEHFLRALQGKMCASLEN